MELFIFFKVTSLKAYTFICFILCFVGFLTACSTANEQQYLNTNKRSILSEIDSNKQSSKSMSGDYTLKHSQENLSKSQEDINLRTDQSVESTFYKKNIQTSPFSKEKQHNKEKEVLEQTSTNVHKAILAPNTYMLLPSSFKGIDISANQYLDIQYQDQSQSLITNLEISEQGLQLVGLTFLGIRLFNAKYDGFDFHIDQLIKVDKAPPVKQVVADIVLSYWSRAELLKLLPKTVYVQDIEDKLGHIIQRNILYKNQQKIYTITYATKKYEYKDKQNNLDHVESTTVALSDTKVIKDSVPESIKHHIFNYSIQLQNL